MVTQAERREIGRMGGLTTAIRHDPKVTSAPGRQAAWQRWLDQADGDVQKAERLRKLHLAEIRRKGHAARRKAGKAEGGLGTTASVPNPAVSEAGRPRALRSSK